MMHRRRFYGTHSLCLVRCKQTVDSSFLGLLCMCISDTYIGAETYYNLFTVRKNSEAATDEDRVSVLLVSDTTVLILKLLFPSLLELAA